MSWCTNCQKHAAKGGRVGHCSGNACTRCPWPRCPCSHDNGCDQGWIEVEPNDPASLAQVARCRVCHDWAEALKMYPIDADARAA